MNTAHSQKEIDQNGYLIDFNKDQETVSSPRKSVSSSSLIMSGS